MWVEYWFHQSVQSTGIGIMPYWHLIRKATPLLGNVGPGVTTE